MWKRFIRALKAIFGGAISAMEDPKLILEENIREMKDQVPKMNQNIASIKATVTLLEKELFKYKAEEKDLINKIKAAINSGRDDIAGNYALKLESTRSVIGQTQPQLDQAKEAYNKALEVKKVFMKETERKIQEAKEALRAHDRAKMQSKIADTLAQFEVGGIDQTHQEMMNKINEQTAENEAKVDLAIDSIDTTSMKIEEEAEKLRAQDLVSQFKNEMMMGSANSTSTSSESQELNQRDQSSIL